MRGQVYFSPTCCFCGRSADDRKATDFNMLIESYLDKLGLVAASVPTKCMKMAIELFIKAHKYNQPLMKDVYRDVGQAFNPVLPDKVVKENIQFSLNTVKDKNTPLFNKYFTDYATLSTRVFLSKSAGIVGLLEEMGGYDTVPGGEDGTISGKK